MMRTRKHFPSSGTLDWTGAEYLDQIVNREYGSLARKVLLPIFRGQSPLPAEVFIFPFVTNRALRQTRPMRPIQLRGKPNRDRISSRAAPRTSEPLWPKNSSERRGLCEPLREKHPAPVRSKKKDPVALPQRQRTNGKNH